MNIKPNLHNFAMVVGLAVLGIILARLAIRTKLGSIPVLGDALHFIAAA